jgi:hypothetical protein
MLSADLFGQSMRIGIVDFVGMFSADLFGQSTLNLVSAE